MIKVDETAPTEIEMKRETISKLRYLDFRDCRSTSRKLCFRVEGIRLTTGEQLEKEYLNRWVTICTGNYVSDSLEHSNKHREITLTPLVMLVAIEPNDMVHIGEFITGEIFFLELEHEKKSWVYYIYSLIRFKRRLTLKKSVFKLFKN